MKVGVAVMLLVVLWHQGVLAADISILWFQWDPCFALRDQWVPSYDEANVTVTCVPIGTWHDIAFADFESGAAAAYDLVILDSQWIGEAVSAGHIVELTEFVEREVDRIDYFDAPFRAYSEYPPNSDRFYGIPFQADVQMMIFRKDIWADLGIDDVASITDLLEVALIIEGSSWDIGGYATLWCTNVTSCYDQGATAFNQMAWSFGGDIWDSTKYQIDGILQSEANVMALELARQLTEVGPAEGPDCDFDCIIRAICHGDVAMATIWAGFGPALVNEASCPLASQLGFTVFPGENTHILSLGGMGIHINNHVSQSRKDLAFDFVRWQMSRQQQREWTRYGGFSARKSVLASGLFLNSQPYAPVFAVSYPLVMDFWNLPEFADLLAVQMDYLGRALHGEMTPRAALEAWARNQQAILDEVYPNGPPEPDRDRVGIKIGARIAFLTIAGLLMIICAGLAVYVLMKQNVAVFRYSSPFFMVMILLSLMLMLSSLFAFVEDPPTKVTCNIFLWFSVMGLSLTFACLLAKTWRVVLLWQGAKQFVARSITVSDVLKMVVVICAPVFLLLLVWTIVDTNKPYRDVDALAEDEFVIRCDNNNLSIYLGILFAYLGLFLFGGCILAFLTRNIPSAFGESTHISVIIGNAAFFSVIVVSLIFFISDDPSVIFILEAIGLIFVAILVIALLFCTKLYRMFTGKADVVPSLPAVRDHHNQPETSHSFKN